jgi:hypothetical protein
MSFIKTSSDNLSNQSDLRVNCREWGADLRQKLLEFEFLIIYVSTLYLTHLDYVLGCEIKWMLLYYIDYFLEVGKNVVWFVKQNLFKVLDIIKFVLFLFPLINKEFMSPSERCDHKLRLIIHMYYYLLIEIIFNLFKLLLIYFILMKKPY